MMPLQNIPLTKADFEQLQWQEVIANASERQTHIYSDLFFIRAQEEQAANNVKGVEVFALLGALTSLVLNLNSHDEPFSPMFVFQDSRGTILDDFTDKHFQILRELAPDVVDPEMRARIADVLWVVKRGDFRMAGRAVDAYLESAKVLEDPEDWPYSAKRIERAIQLAASLGKKNTYFPKVIAHIEEVLDRYNGGDPLFFSAEMMRLLQEHRQGDPVKYADLAKRAAEKAASENDWHRSRTYWETKARWHLLENNLEAEKQALEAAVETYVKEAKDATTRPHGGYSVASSYMQQAITALRRIKGTRERVDELHATLLEYQRQSVSEMTPISVDLRVSQMDEKAREIVKGKPLHEAIRILALLGEPPSFTGLRKLVQDLAKRHTLTFVVAGVALNDVGKVIARRPSMHSDDPRDVEAVIRAEMLRQATLQQSQHAVNVVEPARQQINLDYNVRIHDFYPIVNNNPFIPPGREYIYAKGLHAGMMGDLITAAHLLIPQLENSIRYLLYQQGAIISKLDSEGIQEEPDLNTILYRAEIKNLFGEDITFDLQGLLVERFGSNVRNNLAHGLLDQGVFFLPHILYLWWLVLRLCVVGIIVQEQHSQQKPEVSEEDGSSSSNQEEVEN